MNVLRLALDAKKMEHHLDGVPFFYKYFYEALRIDFKIRLTMNTRAIAPMRAGKI